MVQFFITLLKIGQLFFTSCLFIHFIKKPYCSLFVHLFDYSLLSAIYKFIISLKFYLIFYINSTTVLWLFISYSTTNKWISQLKKCRLFVKQFVSFYIFTHSFTSHQLIFFSFHQFFHFLIESLFSDLSKCFILSHLWHALQKFKEQNASFGNFLDPEISSFC